MNSLYKKVELCANLAIVAVALLFSVVLVNRYVIGSSNADNIGEEIKAGEKVLLPDYDWSKSNQHLILILQKGCHFCSESAPFYRRLIEATTGRNDVHLMAALPQESSEAQQYLNELGVRISEVKQASPAVFGVRGTPTLLLVDNKGIVKEVWAGKLPSDKETAVLTRLKEPCDTCN
ncbi:MAG: Redoxin [Blastocatellia bacterium]